MQHTFLKDKKTIAKKVFKKQKQLTTNLYEFIYLHLI